MGYTSMGFEVYAGGGELLKEIEKASTRHANQKDEPKHYFFFTQNVKLRNNSDSSSVHVLADIIIKESGYSPKQQSYKDEFRRHILIIILNLSTCVLNRQWCKIPLKIDAFGAGKAYDKMSYRHFRRAIDALVKMGFIELIKGAKYKGQPQRSVMQPRSVMHGRALYAYLESEDTSPPPFAKVGRIDKDYVMSQGDIDQLDTDEADMEIINTFLNRHSWAAKSPIKRIYSGKVGRAGRLYCNYQQLPQRRLNLRQNCLIDGEPLVEVDIKASHPRLAVALFHKEKLPRDFYGQVEKLTGVYQSTVKHFCQNALSCSSREDALSSFKKNEPHGDEIDFNAVEECIVNMYSKLPLYTGWSVLAMNYEGEILKRVMLDGVAEGIVALPVHDALAVQEVHERWARERFTYHWDSIVGVEACELG
jgi:hypothetical protein